MRRIYLASSWKNEHQPRILALLRGAGHEVYDFRNPQRVFPWPDPVVRHTERCGCSTCNGAGKVGWPVLSGPVLQGFSWDQVSEDWRSWTPEQYLKGLQHPLAETGFKLDFDAMSWADTCVLLLPSGPSAALEAGWSKGARKHLVVHVAGIREPDLMYKIADVFTARDDELLDALSKPPWWGSRS